MRYLVRNMFKLNKDMEYALIAVTEIEKRKSLLTVKEIAEKFELPYKLLAKIMNVLSRKGLLVSVQGKNGGYRLSKDPSKLRMVDIQNALYGNNKITPCLDDNMSCGHTEHCNIQPAVKYLQNRLNSVVGGISIAEMAQLK